MSKLTLKSAPLLRMEATTIDGDRVIFVTEEDRVMFEVTALKDGSGITVRAVDACRVGDAIHTGLLVVKPDCANQITITTPPYGS